MAGRFTYEKFSDIDLNDVFFDSLKADYPGSETSTEFGAWFNKKAASGAQALIYKDDTGIGAFVYTKTEEEAVALPDTNDLPSKARMKLGTLKISDLHRGQRIGEGAIGLALWEWQRSKLDEIYVTVFPKHDVLINLLTRFGFQLVGHNTNGECVYLKSRSIILYDNPYTSFPFIDPGFGEAGYLIFEDEYHDTMFPFSELKDIPQKNVELAVANGLSKIYVSGAPRINYNIGDPVLIYRKYNGYGAKIYKSCVTSLGLITNIIQVKKENRVLFSLEELLSVIGNKSVFDQEKIVYKYHNDYNMIVYELLYYAYFGVGNNVNCAWLMEQGLWSKDGGYPTNTKLDHEEFIKVLKKGNLDVQNIIID